MEAAEEISKQLKIRDLAGLIVIDFIDMLDRGHNFKVEKKLKECIREDRARIQVGRISNFGLLELSRQRLKVTTDTVMTSRCPTCNGYGSITPNDFLYEQLIKVCNEFSLNAIYRNIFLLAGSGLSSIILDNIKKIKKPILSRKVSVTHYPNLGENEFLICSATEILYKNCHEKSNIENFSNYLKISKGDFIKKETPHEDCSNNIQKKRVSYRAKANDYGNNDNKKKVQSKVDKVQKEKIKPIKIFSKNNDRKVEKRQGWWNQ